MGRNARDKNFYAKNNSKCHIWMPLFAKINFPSRLNKIMKPCFDLFNFFDKPQTQTNTRNMYGTCVVTVRKKDNQAK